MFGDHARAREAARLSHAPSVWKNARCLAWVVMPDGWHGLVAADGDDLSRAVARYKTAVSRALKRSTGRQFPVWQKLFRGRVLTEEDDVRAVARHVVMTPQREGLVARMGDYPYWQAVWL